MNFPFIFVERREQGSGEWWEQKNKRKLIRLHTRKRVHAEIVKGSALESAASTVCTATFALFFPNKIGFNDISVVIC